MSNSYAPDSTSLIHQISHQTRCSNCRVLGSDATHGYRVGSTSLIYPFTSHLHYSYYRGYLASCREIVTATRTIADAITDDIPELYVLGNPPASVVAFGSKHPNVDPLEVGDGMSKRGWHLNGLSEPKSVHIACTVGLFRDALNNATNFDMRTRPTAPHFTTRRSIHCRPEGLRTRGQTRSVRKRHDGCRIWYGLSFLYCSSP